jgi:cob(I)alamin adenosyltransferase
MKPNIGQGDSGSCQLFGKGRVYKDECLVELYGDLDELNSHIGHLAAHKRAAQNFNRRLSDIQRDLFVIGSYVSTSGKQPEIHTNRVAWLEDYLQFLEDQLPELKSFILPAGSGAASYAHVCRAVCRRVERNYVGAARDDDQFINCDSVSLAYINRLSDVLFAIARYLNMISGREELEWSGS